MMHSYITDEAFPVAESVNVVATERNLKKCFEPMYLLTFFLNILHTLTIKDEFFDRFSVYFAG